jgi:hypothetical protein
MAQVDISNLPQSTQADNALIQTIINTVLLFMGSIAVLIATISGFRYVISRGNPQEVAKAKDGILYALVGLAVIILAYVIIGFVTDAIAS